MATLTWWIGTASKALWEDNDEGSDFGGRVARPSGRVLVLRSARTRPRHYFLSCLRNDIEGLKVTAGSHRIVYRDYRRLLSRVFPYGIFYTFEQDNADIWAVVDLRRDPEWIRQHLRS